MRDKKSGFTLIELIAVIGIVTILVTIILPKASIYINKTRNIKAIIEARNVVQCVIASEKIYDSKSTLSDFVDEGIINYYEESRTYLQGDMEYATLQSISEDKDAINKIKINNEKIIEWIGENPYKRSEE